MLPDKKLIDVSFVGKLAFLHLEPGALLDDLSTETVLDRTVQESQVNAPLGIIGLGSVLLIPHSKEGLVGEVHGRIDVSNCITGEVSTLNKIAIDSWQGFLADFVIKVFVDEVVVLVKLTVDIRSIFHEFRLGVHVGDFEWVCAVVEIHVPVNSDIVVAWDALPVGLVLLRQLRALLGLVSNDRVHDLRCEAA